MSSNSLQIEKQDIISRIQEIEDPILLQKVRKILWRKTKTVEPGRVSNEELREILQQQRLRNEPCISHEDVLKEIATWR